ncbi:cytochrome b pre-mRNA-processing protein 3 [Sphingomonas sp. BK069]|nr:MULTISPECIES: ubiquinol-cytochrome C chaperone family protein [unclassified Sphingomonas]MBB3348136.1 cytochrome b pre-mRNA-processing protein 3 [Sphingomonas sp. BK069]MBB3473783.1 cytochrome b pre-mRNA-processing protein 3 [Sphingomonas sp. BK345]
MSGWLRRRGPRDEALPLYDAVVARARQPHWYLEGAVPDTLDGRFDMVAAVLAMVLLRLEQAPDGTDASVRLTERFVDDMDAQVRQIGFGDMVVGKHVGKMMGMLGGRLGVYREGLAAPEDGALDAALVRNLYRGAAPDAAALAHVRGELKALRRDLDLLGVPELMEGRMA